MQFVTLFRGGEKVQMSTRAGEFITLRQLRNEVGNDACRFFYVMRSNDQHLDFDLELAKSRTNENPVYYIQYAHARVASVLRQLASKGIAYDAHDGAGEPRHAGVTARNRIADGCWARYPEIIALAGANRAPHTLVHYLRDLAQLLSTPGTTPSSSSSRTLRCATRGSRWRWPRSRWCATAWRCWAYRHRRPCEPAAQSPEQPRLQARWPRRTFAVAEVPAVPWLLEQAGPVAQTSRCRMRRRDLLEGGARGSAALSTRVRCAA